MLDSEKTGTGRTAEIAAFDELARRKNEVVVLQIKDPRVESSPALPVLSVPEGRSLKSALPLLEEYLGRPFRRKGTATYFTTASFIAAVERARGAATALFANPDPVNPTMTSVFDYHEEGSVEDVDEGTIDAGWLQHRAILALRMSREWKAWYGVDGKALDQVSFAAFIADHIQDVVMVDGAKDTAAGLLAETLQATIGGPQQLMGLSRGLEVNQHIKTRNAVSLDNGDITLNYEATQNAAGTGSLRTPSLFYLNIPVFYAGEPYKVPFRLRYRAHNGEITWSIVLFRPDLVFEDSFAGVMATVKAGTSLDVLVGTPEA